MCVCWIFQPSKKQTKPSALKLSSARKFSEKLFVLAELRLKPAHILPGVVLHSWQFRNLWNQFHGLVAVSKFETDSGKTGLWLINHPSCFFSNSSTALFRSLCSRSNSSFKRSLSLSASFHKIHLLGNHELESVLAIQSSASCVWNSDEVDPAACILKNIAASFAIEWLRQLEPAFSKLQRLLRQLFVPPHVWIQMRTHQTWMGESNK